jgi:hypothetical protein
VAVTSTQEPSSSTSLQERCTSTGASDAGPQLCTQRVGTLVAVVGARGDLPGEAEQAPIERTARVGAVAETGDWSALLRFSQLGFMQRPTRLKNAWCHHASAARVK